MSKYYYQCNFYSNSNIFEQIFALHFLISRNLLGGNLGRYEPDRVHVQHCYSSVATTALTPVERVVLWPRFARLSSGNMLDLWLLFGARSIRFTQKCNAGLLTKGVKGGKACRSDVCNKGYILLKTFLLKLRRETWNTPWVCCLNF